MEVGILSDEAFSAGMIILTLAQKMKLLPWGLKRSLWDVIALPAYCLNFELTQYCLYLYAYETRQKAEKGILPKTLLGTKLATNKLRGGWGNGTISVLNVNSHNLNG